MKRTNDFCKYGKIDLDNLKQLVDTILWGSIKALLKCGASKVELFGLRHVG